MATCSYTHENLTSKQRIFSSRNAFKRWQNTFFPMATCSYTHENLTSKQRIFSSRNAFKRWQNTFNRHCCFISLDGIIWVSNKGYGGWGLFDKLQYRIISTFWTDVHAISRPEGSAISEHNTFKKVVCTSCSIGNCNLNRYCFTICIKVTPKRLTAITEHFYKVLMCNTSRG